MFFIAKVLNVNVVLAKDESGAEAVLLGSGIGFSKKCGESVDCNKIERVFHPREKDERNKLLNLLTNIPIVYFHITEKIVEFAKEYYGFELSESIFMVLPDHLHFAVQRYISGTPIVNRINNEICSFYPEEYNIGVYGVNLLNSELCIKLPTDEASIIAFHITNQGKGKKESDVNALRVARMVSDIESIIKYTLSNDFEKEDIDYNRLITHLKFLAQRFYSHKLLNSDEKLYQTIIGNLTDPQAELALERINRFFVNEYGMELPHEELAYIGMHLYRITLKRKDN